MEVTPETIELPKPSSDDVGYYAVPYVVVDDKYYYGENLWVDLGLPSGILWARHNVGATSSEEYGGYYAWGETEEKSYYGASNYRHFDLSSNTYINIGQDISGSKYDVASIKWGDGARLPKLSEISELINKCIWKNSSLNGVTGSIVTGPNGNSIFIPYAGMKYKDEHWNPGIKSYTMSSTIVVETDNYSLRDEGGIVDIYDSCREDGCSVRPVKDKEE